VLTLPETTLADTHKRAEQIRLGVRQLHLAYKELILDTLTISLGVASYPDHGTSFEDLMRIVDLALYQAKDAGRDRVAVATRHSDAQ